MKIKCIALDLDRTTLNSQGRLGEENKTAIRRALENGIEIVVASGRSLDALPADILEIPGIRYAITSNGAAVYDLKEGICLRQYKMTPESVEAVLACAKGEDVAFEAFIDGKPYAEKQYVEDPVRFGAMPRAIPYIRETRTPVEGMRRFIRKHREDLDCMDLVVKSEEEKEKLWKRISRQTPDVYITSSVSQLLEISDKKAGKDAGAAFLLDHLGLPREALAAFGDGQNDCGLLRFAGLGFAVANAVKECRGAADRIVASNDEGGVAEGIASILGGEFQASSI